MDRGRVDHRAYLLFFLGAQSGNGDNRIRYLVIRWRHALTWLLLAVRFSRSVRGIGKELNGGASFLALAGG